MAAVETRTVDEPASVTPLQRTPAPASTHRQETSLNPQKRGLEVRSHPNLFVALRDRCMPGDRSAIFYVDNTSERSATHVWQRTTQEKATERSVRRPA